MYYIVLTKIVKYTNIILFFLKSFCYFLHLKKTHQFNVFKLTI